MDSTEIMKLSASFNVVDIANIIAELITKKEGKKFVTMIRHKNNYNTYKTYVVVTDEYMKNEDLMYGNVTSEAWVHNTISYGSYIDIYHSDIEDDDVENKDVTFEGILASKYGIYVYSKNGNKNTFKNYEYVNRFIGYLFVLQLANNGKHLTYTELQDALAYFLEMEKDNHKIRNLNR